jgi:four helix bundle protein
MRLEHMRVWQAAERLMAEADRIAGLVRNTSANAADHLERSAEAVLFNTGEGVGAYKPSSKINCYEIARREANEVRAILRRLVIKRALTNDDIRPAYELAGAVIGMLTAAIIAQTKRLE